MSSEDRPEVSKVCKELIELAAAMEENIAELMECSEDAPIPVDTLHLAECISALEHLADSIDGISDLATPDDEFSQSSD